MIIRIDDFPAGSPNLVRHDDRDMVIKMLSILNSHKMNFMLGVSPLLLQNGDIDLLNDNIGCGRSVMHGFDHGFGRDSWDDITKLWPSGGEFSGLTVDEINERYCKSDDIMKQLITYDKEDFIPPFNCYTQETIDVLASVGVKRIHCCDQEWNNYGYDKLNYRGLLPIVYKLKGNYDFASDLVGRVNKYCEICLHWMFDIRRPDWELHYNRLCEAINRLR